MRYTFVGKNFDISDKLKEKITSKIDRLSRLFDKNADVHVTITQQKQTHKVEVTIPLAKRTLRAEAKDFELNTALDQVVDVVEKQLVKYKERLRSRSRNDHSLKDEFKMTFENEEPDGADEGLGKIEKVKRFEVKPMSAEDAAMEMELLGHNFFVFKNDESGALNVVYKRKDGSFGLIEPEM